MNPAAMRLGEETLDESHGEAEGIRPRPDGIPHVWISPPDTSTGAGLRVIRGTLYTGRRSFSNFFSSRILTRRDCPARGGGVRLVGRAMWVAAEVGCGVAPLTLLVGVAAPRQSGVSGRCLQAQPRRLLAHA